MSKIKLSLAAIAVCSSAFAVDTVNLGDVTVSASKIEQSTLEAPVNVSVITTKDIEKSNNQRLGDALNAKVPGLYLRGGALGNARPGVTMLSSMRGQGGTLTKLAVLVDGMNMVDAYSGQVNWAMVSMDDVENIEVVPGVGSSLYGSNAMGGVISIKTKEPTKEEMSFNMGKGYGDSAGEYMSALYRNKFDNGLGVVFGVSQNNRDGYVSDYVTKTPSGAPLPGAVAVGGAIQTTTTTDTTTYIVGDKGLNASKAQNIHAKVYYDLSHTSKIHAGFAYSDNKSLSTPYNSYLTNAATGNSLPITATATNLSLNGLKTSIKEQDFASSIPMGNTVWRYFGGYDGKIGDNKLSINFGKIDRDSWNASIGSTATLSSGAGTLSTSPNSTTNASVQVSIPYSDIHYLIVGAATEIGELNQKKYAISDWTDMDTKTAELDRIEAKSTTNSLFLQDQISIGDDLILYVGGRYDSWTAGGKGVVTTGSVPGTFDYADRSESAFSPKIAAVYMLNNRTSIKSSVGTGFRAPTNYYLFANPTFSGAAAPNGKMIYSNPDLKPEKAKAFDLGVEYHFVDGGKATATYFVTKTTNLIYQKVTKVPQYTDPIINKVIDYESRQENTGEALAKGIELAGEYPLADWLSVRGSYAYTKSVITEDNTNTGMEGMRVTNVPKELISAAFEVEKGDWSGVLSGRYVGEQFSTNDNSDTVKDVWTGYSKYTVVDLKANYQINKNMKASVMVDNLFDREYFEYYRMPGRGVTLQLSANF
ncbi:MAG: TonB-dependent receptor [Sulfuricurvum sp.]|uniref:TonB-dependent receptor n=1 Tax=Sulfuricurvum sp. TaxID=2025608 RepID=UPI0025F37A45|nr:TonB-dependent receptor [Sulfuricurvum sp.]MBV5321217.1 TonB-dependent receptor [Sulfuricurvum sp.]